MVLEKNGEDRESNEQVLERIGDKRTFLNKNLRRTANLIGQVMKRNCLLHDVMEGQMTDDLRNRRRY